MDRRLMLMEILAPVGGGGGGYAPAPGLYTCI